MLSGYLFYPITRRFSKITSITFGTEKTAPRLHLGEADPYPITPRIDRNRGQALMLGVKTKFTGMRQITPASQAKHFSQQPKRFSTTVVESAKLLDQYVLYGKSNVNVTQQLFQFTDLSAEVPLLSTKNLAFAREVPVQENNQSVAQLNTSCVCTMRSEL